MRSVAFVPILLTALASCVAPPARVSSPRPAVPVTIAPPPVAVPPVAVAAGAVEPGSWRYGRSTTGTTAQFGAEPGSVSVSFDCNQSTGMVVIRVLRLNSSAPSTTVVLRATSMTKPVAISGGSAFGQISIPARDPVLDAIAFSRGKFGISLDGRERWFPAWPEIARVIEDCRS